MSIGSVTPAATREMEICFCDFAKGLPASSQ